MNVRNLIGVLLLLWTATVVTAQDMFTVTRYGTHDGMPHNLTQCYAQDSQGFLWIGTRNGLSRFDGIAFHNYKTSPRDEVRMNSNRIKYIWVSSTDRIWIQTFDYQIYLLDPKTQRFHIPIGEIQTTSRTKVYTLQGGITYVLKDYRSLFRFDENAPDFPGDGYRPLRLEETDGSFYSVFRDSYGREWIMGSRGVSLMKGDTLCPVSPVVYDKMWETGGNLLLASKRGEIATLLTDGAEALSGQGSAADGPSGIRIVALAHCPPNFAEIFPVGNEAFLVKTGKGIWLYALDGGVLGQPEQLWDGPTPRDKEMLMGSDGTFWAFDAQGNIARRDPYTHETETLPCPHTNHKQGEKSIRVLHEDRQGHIWVLTDEGLLCHYSEERQRMEPATWHQSNGVHQYVERVRYFYSDRHRNLWLSTTDGMDLVTCRPLEFEWVGTTIGGEDDEGLANRQNVRCVFEDGHCNLWLGTQDKRMEIYDRNDQYVGNLSRDGRLVRDHDHALGVRIYSMIQDRSGNLWMGTRDDGVYVLRQTTNGNYTIRRFRHDDADPWSVSENAIFALCQDAEGHVWVGTFGGGLCLALPDGNGGWKFLHRQNGLTGYPQSGYNRIRSLAESADGTMMVGTTDGLITFNAVFDDPGQLTFYRNSVTTGRPDCLNSNDICHLMQDRSGRIYISTMDGGVNVAAAGTPLLSDSIPLESYSQRNGLQTDVILATMEDLSGRIWVVSPNAFSRWDVENGTFRHILPDFLKSQITLTESTPIVDRDGNLVLGTTNGALRLLADRMQPSRLVPPLVFDNVQIHGTENYTKLHSDGRVDIKPGERNLTVSFIALDYSAPAEVNYAYRLREDGNSWISLGHNRQVNFSNLPPGDHTLEVHSTNGDGMWTDNTARLLLHVIPTFWETGYAIALYVLLAIILILLSAGIIAYVTGLRRKVSFERQLTEMKLRFFTDISHELRTPLTLIAGPIDVVLERENLTADGRDIMQTARRNTEQMLRLVGQILDFKKVQSGKMKVHLEQTDVEAVAHRVYLNFTGMAMQRGMTYTHDSAQDHLIMATDADKVEKILSNILSNAFKYTPDGRSVTLRTRTEGGRYVMQVMDEGKGFNIKEKARFFLRFETDDAANPRLSSGIGLALTKELVRVLHGTIDVKSSLGEGSTFTVTLPMDTVAFGEDVNVVWTKTEDADDAADQKEGTAGGDEAPEATPTEVAATDEVETETEADAERTKPCLLIIDDNADLRHFIRHILGREYDVHEAADGREGLDRSRELNPDLVICDIMMPVMDGIAYLNALKGDRATSHIPVLLLTAKTSIEDQIRGMEYGADDYITKPFHTVLLRTKIAALLLRRQRLRDYYLRGEGTVQVQADAGSWEPSVPQITGQDNAFITRVIEGIREHVADPDFKIELLAQSMNVSRSVFYRKIKAIVGLSPIDFVKNVRIRCVTELMEEGISSVTELAYRCGFSTPQYLSRVFKEVTGTTPTEYIRKRPTPAPDGHAASL